MNTISDEEYLISQMLNALQTDDAAAKSWMIFAKSVYPQSFAVLFQCYKIECDEKNWKECAVCLSDLIKKFPKEPILIKELRKICEAFCSDADNPLKQIFEQLPEKIKYEVMLAVTRSAQTIEEHCALTLLFLKKMPNAKLLQCGSNIIDTLVTAENRPGTHIPINLFRKMLVCDALPSLLRLSHLDYKAKVVFQLLQKAMEFYIYCMFTLPTPQDATIRKEVINQSDSNPNEGWKRLLTLLEIVALRYRWSYPDMFVSNFSDLSLQRLLSLLKRKNKTIASLSSEKHGCEEMSGFGEAYLCLVVIFFYYLFYYGRLVLPKMPLSSVPGSYNYFLMEGITVPQKPGHMAISNEYKQTERGCIVVSRSAPSEISGMLVLSFVTAVECWELLHRHQQLMKEFKILCKNIQLETWPIFQEFYIGMLMYERTHREAIEHLNRVQVNDIDHTIKNKIALQIASCHSFLGEYERCLKILFEVIANLPETSSSLMKPPLDKCPTRYIYFMGYNNREILQYCVSLLLKLYKSKESVDDKYKDVTFGYMLVLMQYDLDHEYELLNRCIESIKKAKSFCFQKFFNYIINVIILEEISYLQTPAGGNVNLEILSTPTFQASKQCAVTEGVNKGSRDDLKQAFLNQVARCYDNLDNLFIEFIKEEHTLLLLPLNDSK